MVRHIFTSGHGVDAVIGDAGTGKTYALGVVRKIYQDAGYQVIGASLAATAAKQMQLEAKIPSSTIASLRQQYGVHQGRIFKRGRTVLIIDEAAMVGTQDTAALIAMAESHNIKLVFQGDDKQLPAIEAGGFFSFITEAVGAPRLSENLRQIFDEQKILVDAFRDGCGQEGLLLAAEYGQLHVAEQHEQTIENLHESWAADPQRDESLMIAGRRDEVKALNELAQKTRLSSGALSGKPLSLDRYDYFVGDRVRCRAKDGPRSRVRNGTLGTVVAIDKRAGTLTIHTDEHARVKLSREFLSGADNLQPAYAITAHSAQGSTCWNAYVLVTNQTFRELLYTAASRAKHVTHFYATTDSIEPAEAGYEPDKIYEPLASIFRGAGKSQAQSSAIATGEPSPFDEFSTEVLIEVLQECRDEMHASLAAKFDIELIEGEAASGRHFDDADVREWAGEHPEEASFYRSLHNEIEQRLTFEVNRMLGSPSSYLVEALGRLPEDPMGRNAWRVGARHVERYRRRFGVDDQARGLGERPKDFVQLQAYRRAWVSVEGQARAAREGVTRFRGRSL